MIKQLVANTETQHRALKLRIYPTEEQEILINKTFGCCRQIYNNRLFERNEFGMTLRNELFGQLLFFYDSYIPCRSVSKYFESSYNKTMNVLMINGSPHANGNTSLALDEMKKIFEENGIEVNMLHIGNKAIRGCIACGSCAKNGKCVFDDEVNQAASLFERADGLVVASPVYYASANGTLVSFLDRLFYSAKFDKTMKVGASVVVARRGGCSATFDELNKYFTICGMPVASSQYWNCVHGAASGEAAQDSEGLQTMRVLARNMTFLMKSIALGKEKFGLPEKEEWQRTNFIR